MALPGSGTITAAMINTELGRSSTATFSINAARNGDYVALNPYSPTLPPSTGTVSFASWYGYCQSCSFYWPNAKFGNDFFNVCFETPTPVYTISPTVGVNTIIYLDPGLTTALGSADYISIPDVSGGLIWNIALTTGQITGDTGNTC